jgi:hypothetical protein
VAVLSAAWFGPPARAGSALAELRRLASAGADLVRPVPYVGLQRMADAMVPRRVRSVQLGGFTGPLTTGVIEALATAATEPPPMCAVMLQPLGGAVARVPAEATAFAHRDAAHYLAVNTIAPPEDSGAEQAAWAETVAGSLPTGTILRPGLPALGRTSPNSASAPSTATPPTSGSPPSSRPTTLAMSSGSTRTSARRALGRGPARRRRGGEGHRPERWMRLSSMTTSLWQAAEGSAASGAARLGYSAARVLSKPGGRGLVAGGWSPGPQGQGATTTP